MPGRGKEMTVKKGAQTPSGPQDPEESHGFLNIMKVLFLVAVLAGAWFLLDWLINGK
jgi:hypothetical protein